MYRRLLQTTRAATGPLAVQRSSSSSSAAHQPHPRTASASAPQPQHVDTSKPTFHKRPLPEHLISLSSQNGKRLFREALAAGGMESFFALAEQFVTQSEPSYCALSSLAMVLNALNFDPKKVWKGAWRWVSEETLQCETEVCGHSLEKVQRRGMDFDEFESLARCHGIRIKSYKADESLHSPTCTFSVRQFRAHVEAIASSDHAESFMIVNFSRKVLGQTGDGHYSPIGGYHKEKDLVLVMDVARFKYPPFWVPLETMWESMAVKDKSTEQPRGYFILTTSGNSGEAVEGSDLHDTSTSPHHSTHSHSHSHGHSHSHSHGHSHSHSHGHSHSSSSSSSSSKNDSPAKFCEECHSDSSSIHARSGT